jgi:hypothetical protein
MNQDAFLDDIHSLIQLTVYQNYFEHNNVFFSQTDGLAVGAPISSSLAEIFIKYMAHKRRAKRLQAYDILDYHRYVHDIFLFYNKKGNMIDNI